MKKLKLATVWLDGCSGCHMSLLDLDERIADVLQHADFVYSPLIDVKECPENVDVAVVEGAVSSPEDLHKLRTIRVRSKMLIAVGDCAVTANVPAMRNPLPVDAILQRAYLENATASQQVPSKVVPQMFPKARPIHEFVAVDVFVPGCPPSADLLFFLLSELLNDRAPDLSGATRFGA